MEPDVYVGLDVHKSTVTIAIADQGRCGEVRRYGSISNSPSDIAKLVRKIEVLPISWTGSGAF